MTIVLEDYPPVVLKPLGRLRAVDTLMRFPPGVGDLIDLGCVLRRIDEPNKYPYEWALVAAVSDQGLTVRRGHAFTRATDDPDPAVPSSWVVVGKWPDDISGINT